MWYMVVGFTTTYVYDHHWCCEFKPRPGRGAQHLSVFFSGFPPPIKLKYCWKWRLSTIKPNHLLTTGAYLPSTFGSPTASMTILGFISRGLNDWQAIISSDTTAYSLTLSYPLTENLLHFEKSIVPFNTTSNDIWNTKFVNNY